MAGHRLVWVGGGLFLRAHAISCAIGLVGLRGSISRERGFLFIGFRFGGGLMGGGGRLMFASGWLWLVTERSGTVVVISLYDLMR